MWMRLFAPSLAKLRASLVDEYNVFICSIFFALLKIRLCNEAANVLFDMFVGCGLVSQSIYNFINYMGCE